MYGLSSSAVIYGCQDGGMGGKWLISKSLADKEIIAAVLGMLNIAVTTDES